MNYYEIVYIIHPALQAGHLDDIISQVNKKIENLNGKILYQDNWGKKKMSYLIQKQKYGTYYIFQCELDGKFINELSADFEHNTNVLRFLISKIDETNLIKDANTVENSDVSNSNETKNNQSKESLDKTHNAQNTKEVKEENTDESDAKEVKEENTDESDNDLDNK